MGVGRAAGSPHLLPGNAAKSNVHQTYLPFRHGKRRKLGSVLSPGPRSRLTQI
jgi:hypothetical protein